MNEKQLAKELGQRGTAEISNGVVNQVTQALGETETQVKYLMFGELRTQGIISIDEACAKCDHWKQYKFESVVKCQERQMLDGRARGFTKMICPQQLID